MTSAAAQPEDSASLRAERDAWEARARAAEETARRLADELADARAGRLSLFDDHDHDDAAAGPVASLAAAGSDPRLLSLALAAMTVVMAMVSVLSLANNGVFSAATLLIVAITIALGWGAWQSRVVKPKVAVVKSVVLIEVRGQTHRFDLRNDSTDLEVVGRPGEIGWCVRFLRRGLPPLTVDAGSVDPTAFMAWLREWRPEE